MQEDILEIAAEILKAWRLFGVESQQVNLWSALGHITPTITATHIYV